VPDGSTRKRLCPFSPFSSFPYQGGRSKKEEIIRLAPCCLVSLRRKRAKEGERGEEKKKKLVLIACCLIWACAGQGGGGERISDLLRLSLLQLMIHMSGIGGRKKEGKGGKKKKTVYVALIQ